MKKKYSHCFTLQYNQFFKGKGIPAKFSAIEYHSIEEVEQYAGDNNIDRLLHLSGFIDEASKKKYWHKDFLKKLTPMNIKLFSFDCGPSADDIIVRNGVFVPSKRILSLKEVKKRFAQYIKQIRQYYHGPIAVENLNYYPNGAYEHICRPEIIRQLVETNDVLILLDIAHLLISSFFLKIDPLAYFYALPKERIIQIHLSRPVERAGYLLDAHFLPLRREEKLLIEMSKSISPKYLTVEYNKNKDNLLKKYCELEKILN